MSRTTPGRGSAPGDRAPGFIVGLRAYAHAALPKNPLRLLETGEASGSSRVGFAVSTVGKIGKCPAGVADDENARPNRAIEVEKCITRNI